MRAAARFAGDREVRYLAYQTLPDEDFARLGVTRAECEARLRFRNRRGRWFGGAFAVNRFLWFAAPPGLRGAPARTLVLAFYLLPPLLLLEVIGYALVARNRGCDASGSAVSGQSAGPTSC